MRLIKSMLEAQFKICFMTTWLLLLAARCIAFNLQPSCKIVGNSDSVHKILGFFSILSSTLSLCFVIISRPIMSSSSVFGDGVAGAPRDPSTADSDDRPVSKKQLKNRYYIELVNATTYAFLSD